ncbi:unnamed protein product [Kluyveromyces dobzhanskii CBS 2104]|uniref:WGS project CCBQ000000000 data, contig 00014 n=1 Tax=Kluyveromyces dobzhanskii CBS 2104 TaxID=1427455 RepID=A0A0A8L709_9SACH|nr:unnamed protein product [Kluyveromyces dobzhanskii CBS 2104]
MNNEERAKLERRRSKFSEQRRQELLNDPLKDKSLLSRSTAGNETMIMTKLKKDQTARDQFFCQIQDLARTKDADDELLEHGLRKLREIIVSVYDDQKHDLRFIYSIKDVYSFSIEFYLQKSPVNWTKLASILEAMVQRVSTSADCKVYASALTLYEAIETQQHSRALQKIRENPGHYWDPASCRMLIESCATSNYHQWFCTLSSIPNDSILFKLTTSLPYHDDAVNDMLLTISRAYNQLSMAYLTEFWFHSVPIANLKSSISSRWTISQTNDDVIIKFKN